MLMILSYYIYRDQTISNCIQCELRQPRDSVLTINDLSVDGYCRIKALGHIPAYIHVYKDVCLFARLFVCVCSGGYRI